MINPLHPKPPTSIIKNKTKHVFTCMWLVTHFLPSCIYLFENISLKSSVTWAIGFCHFRSKTHEYLLGLLALWGACKAIVHKIFPFWTFFVTVSLSLCFLQKTKWQGFHNAFSYILQCVFLNHPGSSVSIAAIAQLSWATLSQQNHSGRKRIREKDFSFMLQRGCCTSW